MWKCLVFATLAVLAVLTAGIARGQMSSSSVDISSSVSRSKHPAIAVGPAGDIHVVWEGWMSGSWEVVYSGKEPGGDWTPPVDVSNTSGASNRPAIAVGEDGTLHVVWHDEASGAWDILYASRAPGGSWSATTNISNNDGWSFQPQIVVGEGGSLHVVWRDNTTGNWQILYASKPVDGPWSLPTPVWSSSGVSSFAALAVGEDGYLHLAWEVRTSDNSEILYATKPPGGSWSSPENVSGSVRNSRRPGLAVAGDGSPQVVWQGEAGGSLHLYHAARGPDGSWSSAADISEDVLSATRSAVVAARDGSLYAAWVGNGSGAGDILFAGRPPGGSWTPAVNISSSDGVSADPALALAPDGAAHVVWDDNTPGSNHIFYASPSTALAASPSTALAATPPPATATPLPQSEAEGSGGGLNRPLLILALAAAGGVVLAGGLLVVARRRWGSR
jgi:hypothetical protein